MKQKCRSAFASNSEKNEVHYTEDGVLFWEKSHALAHARDHKLKSFSMTRSEAEREDSDAEILARVNKRMDEITAAVEPFKQEWEGLLAQKDELEKKLGIILREEDPDADPDKGSATDPNATKEPVTDPGQSSTPPAGDTTTTKVEEPATDPADTKKKTNSKKAE